MIARWVGRPMVTLGTDGFGRSEDRASLRNFFEVDARHVAAAAISALHRDGAITAKVVAQAFKELEIDPEKADPRRVAGSRLRLRRGDDSRSERAPSRKPEPDE